MLQHDDLQRHDLYLFDDGLPVGDLLHIMGGNPFLFQHPHKVVGHPVVDDPLAQDGALFLAVEGGGIVLVIHDIFFRIFGGIHPFGLTLV